MSDKYAVSNKLPAKQVSILAHRRRRVQNEQSLDKVKEFNRRKILAKKEGSFKNVATYIAEHRKADRDIHRMQRTVQRRNFLKTDNSKPNLILVYRHRGTKLPCKVTTKILKTFKLTGIFTARLLPNTPETNALLRLVEPYVIYGYPSLSTIRELVFKHAFFDINDKKETITSNKMIEDTFGDLGLICLEDIIHEIVTFGPHFGKINEKLYSFKLKVPQDGFKKRCGKHYKKGGEYGNRGIQINDFIRRCI